MECESAKELLRQRGIPYVEKDIHEPKNSVKMRALGARAVPTLVIDGRTYIGFGIHEAMIRKALGVPKA